MGYPYEQASALAAARRVEHVVHRKIVKKNKFFLIYFILRITVTKKFISERGLFMNYLKSGWKGVLCVLILVLFPVWGNAEQIKIRVIVESATILARPNVDSEILQKVPIGVILEADAQRGEWYQVTLPPDQEGKVRSGFIKSSFVEVISRIGTVEPQKKTEPVRTIEPVKTIQPRQKTVTKPAPEKIAYKEKRYGTSGTKIMGGFVSANLDLTTSIDVAGAELDLDRYKKSKAGFTGGIGYEIGSKIALEIDLFYIQKGAKFQGETFIPDLGISGNFSVTQSINQISLPVLLKVRVLPGSTPYFFGGGEVAFVLSSEISYTLEDTMTGAAVKDTEDTKDSIKDIDYGLVFGAGFEINFGPIPFYVEGRYHMGLANLLDTSNEEEQLADSNQIKTQALIFVAGIKF
jgi:hypothetical protein